MTFRQAVNRYTAEFFAGADANDLILQMRAWQSNNVGDTPPFGGDLPATLRLIRTPVLYMRSATDLYFPVKGAGFKAGFI